MATVRRMVFVVALTLFGFALTASAKNEVIPGAISGGTWGLVFECGFAPTNNVELDGDLTDLPWTVAPWHTIDSKTGTAPAANDADASVRFSAVADDEWIYFAVAVTDDEIQSGENVLGDVWKDDSIEIYIDADNGKTESYDASEGKWDTQISIGADNIGGDPDAPLLGGTGDGPGTGTRAVGAETADGWIIEAAVPLDSPGKWDFQLEDGLTIGFNLHLNDDDDGGERDHKLIWSKNDLDDQSWQNPSRFAELTFVAAALAVDPRDKAATTWAALKR